MPLNNETEPNWDGSERYKGILKIEYLTLYRDDSGKSEKGFAFTFTRHIIIFAIEIDLKR